MLFEIKNFILKKNSFCFFGRMDKKNLHMRICCFIIILLTIPSITFAKQDCSHTLSGRILDNENNESLSGILIRIIDSEKFAVSDKNGDFTFDDLCTNEILISVSSIGYIDSTYNLNEKNSTIYLKIETLELSSVIIFNEKEKDIGTKTMSQQSINLDDRGVDRTLSLASIASKIDGVTFISTGSNVELPVIHGLYGNRVLVLNNYLKHGFQNWGIEHAPEINISSVSNISVIKGASGVRFGPEALGGAIILEPDPMKLNQSYYMKFGSGYQTNGKGQNFSFKTGNGYKNIGYFLGFDYIKIGDRHTPSYSLTNTGKIEKSINFGLHYHLKNFDIKLYYNYVDLNLALLRSSAFHSGNALERSISSDIPLFIKPFSYSINEPNQLAKHHLAKAHINWWYNENEKVSLTVGSQINKRKEFDIRRNSYKPIIDLDLYTNDYLLEWDHSFSNRIDGLVGLHYLGQNNDNNPGTGTTPFIPNYNSNRISLYIIEALKINRSLLEFGFRLDNEKSSVRGRETNQNIFRDENAFSNLTFTFGYEKIISENFIFRSNLGSAWRTPNMAELYSFGSHGFKATFGLLRYYFESGKVKTNKVLKMSESSLSAEKSYKFINELNYNLDKSNLKMTFYSNYISNFIFQRPIGIFGTIRGPMPYFIYDQSNVFITGSDVTFSRDFSNDIKSNLTLSYLFSKNLDKKDNLINQPPIRITSGLDWETNNFWKINSSIISVSPSYTFKQFKTPVTITPTELINDLVTVNLESQVFDLKDAPEGFFLIDFSWKFKIKSFLASFEVKNLLNRKYRNYLNEMRYFADEPGRNFIINFSYSFKKND